MTGRKSRRTRLKQQMREGEPRGVSRQWRRIFLDYLAETSNVSEAARQAKINPSRAYKVRRNEPEFAKDWLRALWEGYSHLEMEILRRLREGDNSGKDGTKFDFANAIRLLAAHRDNAARARADMRNVSAAEVRASLDNKIEEIRRRMQRDKERESR